MCNGAWHVPYLDNVKIFDGFGSSKSKLSTTISAENIPLTFEDTYATVKANHVAFSVCRVGRIFLLPLRHRGDPSRWKRQDSANGM